MISAFNVIIPVYNEEVALKRTAPALHEALADLPAHLIYVLNATFDESRAVIEQVYVGDAQILDLPNPGKTAALRAGDLAAPHSCTVYLDADVLIDKSTITALIEPLQQGHADLVAPKIMVDLTEVEGLALSVGRVWANQLLRRQDAFMNCSAFSAAGLQRRGPWADVLADDDWARDRIHPTRRKIIETTQAHIMAPRDIKSWIAVRARWIRGTRQLKQKGEAGPFPCSITRPKGTMWDLAVYYAVRLTAEPIARLHQFNDERWERDNSTRVRTDD